METKNELTTIGLNRDTFEEFKKIKLKFQAFKEKEISDDLFIKTLLECFRRFDVVFKVNKE
jgi:hypothetical protein